MMKGAQRVLLETMIDRSLRGLQEDPHRELRKLVDLADTLMTSPAQKHYSQLVQELLANESSPYYILGTSLVQHTSRENLKCVGVNVGYESWCRGAKLIRQLESEYGHNVPWTLVFEAGKGGAALPRERLTAILAQARQMGIHTFVFRVLPGGIDLRTVLSLSNRFEDCAFVLITRAGDLSADADVRLSMHPNCITFLQAEATCAAEEMITRLRRRKVLYALWAPYDAARADALTAPGAMEAAAQTASDADAPLLLLCAEPGCTPEQCRAVGQAASAARMAPTLPVLPVDLYTDLLLVDRTISSGGCLAQIWPDGRVAINGTPAKKNLAAHTLRAVLADSSPL